MNQNIVDSANRKILNFFEKQLCELSHRYVMQLYQQRTLTLSFWSEQMFPAAAGNLSN